MSDWSLDRRTFLQTSGAGAAVVTAGFASGRPPGPKEDEILVGVSAGAGGVYETVAPHVPGDAEIVHKNEDLRYVAVRFPERAADVARRNFVDAVTEQDGVKYAEPNVTHDALLAPNDPYFDQQYVPQQVEADRAWDTTLGSHDVTVAIVDNGVDYNHPDLDGNFCGDPGVDFVDSDTDPSPDTCDEGHGTYVAGVAGAEVDNGIGIAGMGNSCLVSARALDESGSGSTSDIADAIEWATDQGADVINMSFGGGGYTDTMKNAVSYASNNGALPVCAAGNDGGYVSYPAAYSECVAVSAVNQNERLASFSNHGSKIELCAPGVDVLTLARSCSSADTVKLSGTSLAAPAVSGVAGLTLAEWDLTPAELRSHLKNTATDLGLSSDEQGAGQVDAYSAITTDPSTGVTASDCLTDPTTVSGSLVGSDDWECLSYDWKCDDPSEVTVELAGPSDADFDLYLLTGATRCPTPSDYDFASYTADSQESITITNPDTSSPLQICVDSYSGSGDYDLTVTEYQ